MKLGDGLGKNMRLIEFRLFIAFAHLRQIVRCLVHIHSIDHFDSHLK